MTDPELDDDDCGDDDSSNEVPSPSWFALHVWLPVYYALRLWRVRQLGHAIARWWHCLRFGMLPLGEWIRIESIKVSGAEQLAGPGGVPGMIFGPGAWSPILGVVTQAGQSITLEVRNVGRKPVRFAGVAQLGCRDGRFMMYPFPMPILPVGELKTICITLNQLARFERLMVPEYVPKEPRVARETQQKVEQ